MSGLIAQNSRWPIRLHSKRALIPSKNCIGLAYGVDIHS
jgi:hypothetical protein